MHMCRLPSFLCTKRMGALYGLMLVWIQPQSRYMSSFLYTSAYSVGDKQYWLGLGDWASGFNKVMSCVTRSQGRKMVSSNTSQNLSNKAKIYGILAPGGSGVWSPSYSPLSTSLAPIARRVPDGCKNMNHAALCDFQMVFIKNLIKHSSTWISHNNKVSSTT